jgi:TolB-like protein/Tfp pilus assembly protein PilF
MFTDIVGYTALMGSDEKKAFEVLRKNRNLHKPIITKYQGTFLKEIGDGILASFNTATDAVRCAGAIQNQAKKEDIELRIGIHLGDVVFEGDDVWGDGVNVASRLEEIAEAGSIYISGAIYNNVRNKEGIKTEFLGEKALKNVDEPVKVYKVQCEVQEEDQELLTEKKLNKRSYNTIGGVLLLVVIAVLIWLFYPRKQAVVKAEELDKSIAVLPFRNDSPDQENEYFCNGMVESILTNLQKIGDLRVKSRTDAEQYRNPDKDLKAIARDLKVAFILEGSVQKVGDNIRITAQLIEGSTGDHLWADNYDGKYTNEIFTFQSNVAKRVASSLQAVINPEEEKRIDRKSTSEIMAYDLYWRGMDMLDEYSRIKDHKYIGLANELFNKALSIDPEYSNAIYGKGHAHKMVADNTDGNYDSAMIYADRLILLAPVEDFGYALKGSIYAALDQADLAIEYYLKAIERYPNNNWPYAAIGWIYCEQKNDYISGISYIEKAVKLEGRAPYLILNTAGWTYLALGDYEKAMKYYKQSINLLPGCYNNILGYFWTLASQGKLSELQHFTDSICGIIDCKTECKRFRFWIHSILRDYEQAERWYNQFIEGGGSPNSWDNKTVALVYKKLGKENEAMTIIDNTISSLEHELNERSGSSDYYYLASAYCQLGNKEEALQYLTKAVDLGLRYGLHDFMEIDPTFDNLRDDSKFRAIVKRAQDEKAAFRAQVREMIESGEIDL